MLLFQNRIQHLFNQTIDNQCVNQGFAATHTADIPISITQDKHRNTVTGHMIFNHVGSLTIRCISNIEGNSRQKHLVQSLCMSIPGK